MNESDLEALAKAKPYLRNIVAFLLYAWGPIQTRGSKEMSYKVADDFTDQLEKDVKRS